MVSGTDPMFNYSNCLGVQRLPIVAVADQEDYVNGGIAQLTST